MFKTAAFVIDPTGTSVTDGLRRRLSGVEGIAMVVGAVIVVGFGLGMAIVLIAAA